MEPNRILAEHTPGKVHLHMLGTSLRRVFAVDVDGSFDALLRRLDETCSESDVRPPEPRPPL